MDWSLILVFLVIGVVIGFLAGLLGIGGGMTLVPMLTFIYSQQNFPPQHVVHIAVATAMATVLFTSLSSIRAHHARRAVRWSVVWAMAPGLLLGGFVGAQLASLIKSSWLAAIFAAFNIFAATQLARDRKPHASRALPSKGPLFLVGGGIGVISSLVAAGGAFMSVPFMVWCNVKMQEAIGTAAALGLPVAFASTLGYIISGWSKADLPPHTIGFIYWPALAAIVAASVLAAPYGAAAAHRWPTQRLKTIFAGLLYLLAAYMLWRAISAP